MNDKQFTDDELQLMAILANEGLASMDFQMSYFRDTWFERQQIKDLVKKLDDIDYEIRRIKKTDSANKRKSVTKNIN